MLTIYDLKTEYKENPIGIDERSPAFSWKLRSDRKETFQKSYRVCASLGEKTVWDSGTVETDRSLYIPYEGESLAGASRYDVTVTVTDNHGESARAQGFFETGLLSGTAFAADWITHGFEDTVEACPVFVKTFSVSKPVAKARVYISALGLYEMKLNDSRVGDARFTPGWTSYQERLQYQTYDITDSVARENRVEITLSNGWYKGILGFFGQGCHYGTRTALIAQIDLTYADGSFERIVTDETWLCATAERRYSEIYNGEIIDYSQEYRKMLPVRKYDYTKQTLVAQINEPVRITERLPARKLLRSPRGEWIIDFGQNMAGVVEARLCCPRGTKVTLSHGEALDENGNLFTTNLRTAKATDVFICSGGEDVFLPEFTYHGFRYVRVEGLEEINLTAFTACVIHTDYRKTGSFRCSNEDINRLWDNIDWTMRSNFLDIPMDCPQRDERLGYTGDTEIFLPTAVFYGDVALHFRKWLRDLRTEQTDEFGVPLSVPDILRTHACVSIWHDAATVVPWVLYRTYGDKRLLEEQYDSMAGSVAYTRRLAGEGGLLRQDNCSQFGDWLALDSHKGPFRKTPEGIMYPTNEEKGGGTDVYMIGNVYYLYSLDIMAKTAAVLERERDAREYRQLYQDVLRKFRAEYITANGRLVSDTQTAAALALHFDLLEKQHRPAVLERLVLNLIGNKKHLRTGFVGTQYLMQALSENGQHALAGDILLKDDCPSWLYGIRLGATTVWELWDGVNPDGSFNLFEMNSLNQFGFGSVGDWLHKQLCGITALEPGYKKIRVAPRLVSGITWVKGAYESVYGKVSWDFSCENGVIRANIQVPGNTTAVIDLPGKEPVTVGSGEYSFCYQTELSFDRPRYTEDTTLEELLRDPVAGKRFADAEPELAQSGFVRFFAGGMSLVEIRKLLPRTMMPERAVNLLEQIMEEMNRAEKQKTV